MHMVRLSLLGLLVTLGGCSDVSSGFIPQSGVDAGTDSFDGQIVNDETPDMSVQVMPTPFPEAAIEMLDQGQPLEDSEPESDMAIAMGPPCDPRLRAGACEQGFYCLGSSEFEGTCEPGVACDALTNDGCSPPEGNYCHLVGRTTLCTEAGDGIAGDDCENSTQSGEPCADGFLCNGSICVEVCDPQDQSDCDNGGRCADITASLGQPLGLCVERNCNIYTGRGCSANQFCRFAIATDGNNVGSCRALPSAPKTVGEACVYGVDDDCEIGASCVRAPNGNVCRALRDSGGYEITCPDSQACTEAIRNSAGNIRGIGVCVPNL